MGNLFASKKANTYQSQPVIRNELVQPVNRNDPIFLFLHEQKNNIKQSNNYNDIVNDFFMNLQSKIDKYNSGESRYSEIVNSLYNKPYSFLYNYLQKKNNVDVYDIIKILVNNTDFPLDYSSSNDYNNRMDKYIQDKKHEIMMKASEAYEDYSIAKDKAKYTNQLNVEGKTYNYYPGLNKYKKYKSKYLALKKQLKL